MLIILIKAKFYTEVSKTRQANFRIKEMLMFYRTKRREGKTVQMKIKSSDHARMKTYKKKVKISLFQSDFLSITKLSDDLIVK